MTRGDGPISVLVLGLRWPPETFVANILAHMDPSRVQVTVACPAGAHGARPPVWRRQLSSGSSPAKLALGASSTAWRLLSAPADQRRLAMSMLADPSPVRLSRDASTLGHWDVVYFPWTVGPAGFAGISGLEAPIVVSCRGAQVSVAPLDPDRPEVDRDLRQAFSLATLVHCVSDDLVQAAIEFGMDPARARVIRPAVDTTRFSPDGPRTAPAEPCRSFELVTTGTLYWRKGSEDLLVALREAVDAGADVGLTIIGDGPDEARVRFTIADLGLADRVRLVGRRTPDQVASMLRGADGFVLASLSEGISNAVLEGMATGRPVVSTAAGGMGEAVTDGREGRLVEPGDPHALAEALIELAADPEASREMGHRGRERVLAEFDLRQQAEAYTALFEEAASRGLRVDSPAPVLPSALGQVMGQVESVVDGVRARTRARTGLAAGRLAVITFHNVPDPEQFATLVDALVARVHPVSLDAVIEAQDDGRPLPPRSVLLTFDDGHPSVLDHGLPTLRAHGVPAAVFVVAGLIDTDQPFWWDEVVGLVQAGGFLESGPPPVTPMDLVNHLKTVTDEMRRAALAELRATARRQPVARQLTTEDLRVLEAGGIAVGSHSLTHPILVQCDDETIRHEVGASRAMLTTMLGHPPRSIAYPSGRVDDRVVAAVTDAGYEIGFGWRHAVAHLPTPDRFRIPRMHCSAGASRGRLVLLAEGRHRSLAGTDRPGGG